MQDSRRTSLFAKRGFHYLILVALSFLLRAPGLDFGLPYAVARPDEEAIVENAVRLEREDTWNPAFFSYPSLMIYTSYGLFKVMHVALRTAGETGAPSLNALFLENPACFHWTIRFLSLICGSLTPVVVFASARQLYGAKTAWLAGLILALCYLHVRDSHFGTTDVPFVFLVCLSFWQLTRFYRSGRLKNLIVASIFAGLAIGTKYTGAWLCLPFSVAIGSVVWRTTSRKRLQFLAFTAFLALAFTVTAFFISSPYFFLDFDRARDHLGFEMKLVHEEAPIVKGINGYVDHFRISLWYGLGWPVLLTALASGLVMLIRRSGKGLLVWSLPLAFYFYSGGSNRIYIRYMVLVVPFMSIACAWAVRSLFCWYRSRRRSAGGTRGRGLFFPTATVFLLLIPSVQNIYQFDQRMMRSDTRLELRQWLLENVPEQEAILWSGGWSATPYMIHHVPVRRLDATEKLQQVLVDDPIVLQQYRWIVLVEWPRAYYRMGRNADERAFLNHHMMGRYEEVYEIDAYKADLPPELFSPLDHFYMSFAQPNIIERPGPGFRIYRRIE